MTMFLAAFSLFNVVLGYAALRRAMKLGTEEGRAAWASARLHAIATFGAWTLPLACILATAFAWALEAPDRHWAPAIILVPTGWLVVMGAFFAIVDVAEDGVMDFGRGPKKP
jgi:hypothetical protein